MENMMKQDAPSGNSSWLILGITAVVTLGGFLFGYDTGVIGGSQLYFTEYFKFTAAEQGWAVSSALYGCLVGAMAAGYLSGRFSRKYALIASGLLFSVSAWGSGIPESLSALVFYRIVGGIGVGIASMTAPMYIAEIAPPRERGRLVSYYQLAIVIGFFIVFLATYFIGGGDTSGLSEEARQQLHHYNVEKGWRMMFWSELIPAVAFFLFLFLVPHSPRWLMMKGREAEAQQVLARILGNPAAAEQECAAIKASLQEAAASGESALKKLFGPGMLAALLIGTTLSVLQQVTGINAILYYGAEIFSKALGYGPEDALKQQILLGAVNLAFTFVAIYQVDRWGRKPLLIVGTLGMAIGIGTLAATLYFEQKGLLSLVGMLTFIGSFALSMGPVTWVLLSEMFPNSVRSAAMSIAVAAQWLFNGLVAQAFPMINESELNHEVFHNSLAYLIFAVLCVVTVLFALRFVPETKGKTLEEIEGMWRR
jgi:SP family xylose:H+ symportor-like MFS transporter